MSLEEIPDLAMIGEERCTIELGNVVAGVLACKTMIVKCTRDDGKGGLLVEGEAQELLRTVSIDPLIMEVPIKDVSS